MNSENLPATWNQEVFIEHLAAPHRAWARDITGQGLEFSAQSRAGAWARDITGQPVTTPDHTAVWLVLALAGAGRVGEAGSRVSLGDYLAEQGARGHEHYRRIVHYSPGTEPDRTVHLVAAVLRSDSTSSTERPDPLLLAADLHQLLDVDAQVRRSVVMRWAEAIAQAGSSHN